MNDKLTILVNSCDAYSDIWDLFFESIRRQWPECPYRMVLNTERKQYAYKDMPIKVHNYARSLHRKDLWGKRYRRTLMDIDSEYVMPFLDDFALTKPVENSKLIEDIITFMDAHPEVTVVYLDAFPKWCFVLEESKVLPGFGKMPQCCSYKLSTAIAVWRREKLISLIRDFESPWEWEMNASFRACRIACGDFYAAVDALEDIPQNVVFPIVRGGVVWRGLWHPDAVQLAKDYEVEIDFDRRGFLDIGNPYGEKKHEPYSLRQNIKQDIFKLRFWKSFFQHIGIYRKYWYKKYRFIRSIL